MSADGEVQRRKLNVVEALVLTGIIALVGSNLMLRDSMLELQINSRNTTDEMRGLKAQWANVPALIDRVTRLEIKEEASAEKFKEHVATQGLR